MTNVRTALIVGNSLTDAMMLREEEDEVTVIVMVIGVS